MEKKGYKRTKYTVMTQWGMSGRSGASHVIHKRVYTDQEGGYYIRKKTGYLKINDLPCMQYICRD